MIEVSSAYFNIDVSSLSEEELERYALRLFKQFEVHTEQLPFSDFSLHLEVEEGSIWGKGNVYAALAVVYFGIGQFGSFVQGVREISNIGKTVANKVIDTAVKEASTSKSKFKLKYSKRNSGKLSMIEDLFTEVRNHEIEPKQAAKLTLDLLTDEGDELPRGAEKTINDAFSSIRLNPRQLDLPIELGPISKPPMRTPSPRPLPQPESTDGTLASMKIVIDRRGKRGERHVTKSKSK